ncbi:unnamed protein product, partial [Nesidiocoris tenuis]
SRPPILRGSSNINTIRPENEEDSSGRHREYVRFSGEAAVEVFSRCRPFRSRLYHAPRQRRLFARLIISRVFFYCWQLPGKTSLQLVETRGVSGRCGASTAVSFRK